MIFPNDWKYRKKQGLAKFVPLVAHFFCLNPDAPDFRIKTKAGSFGINRIEAQKFVPVRYDDAVIA
jgi:hypothetical protein